MAFKLVSEPTFTREVKIKRPVDGGYEIETCKATFLALTTDEAESYDMADPKQVREYLCRIVRHVDEIVDDNGSALEFNDAVRDKLLSYAHVQIAFLDTYTKALRGAREGN